MKNSSRILIEALAHDSEILKLTLREADQYWAPEAPPVTTVLASFAARLVEVSADPAAPGTQIALHIVETAMTSGDGDLVTAAATGFIEGLTASASRHAVMPQFLAALGPRSRKHAEAWLAFEG